MSLIPFPEWDAIPQEQCLRFHTTFPLHLLRRTSGACICISFLKTERTCVMQRFWNLWSRRLIRTMRGSGLPHLWTMEQCLRRQSAIQTREARITENRKHLRVRAENCAERFCAKQERALSLH